MVVDDLRVPPGNLLEVLRGDRKEHSISINVPQQICFRIEADNALEVEIVADHQVVAECPTSDTPWRDAA